MFGNDLRLSTQPANGVSLEHDERIRKSHDFAILFGEMTHFNFKEIVHTKIKICCQFTNHQAIQDVGDCFLTVEQKRRFLPEKLMIHKM